MLIDELSKQLILATQREEVEWVKQEEAEAPTYRAPWRMGSVSVSSMQTSRGSRAVRIEVWDENQESRYSMLRMDVPEDALALQLWTAITESVLLGSLGDREFLREMVEGDGEKTDGFVNCFYEVQEACHQLAISKGWWDDPRHDGELVAQIHGETSELFEALRNHNPPSEHIPEYSAAEEELADIVIRVMDFAAARGMRLGPAILAKYEYNKTRSYRHGGKAF